VARTVNLACELRDTKIKVNSICPGFTATDLNGNTGTQTIEEAQSPSSASRNSPTIARPAATFTKTAPTPGSSRFSSQAVGFSTSKVKKQYANAPRLRAANVRQERVSGSSRPSLPKALGRDRLVQASFLCVTLG
jgi:NAD(P)-dependent dehydrogenase (short-subunit alcohol dehydrogenase family)